ncbi:MAG: anhydro-N-acetylmuramic acid kinase [Rickettsiaceae bacterium]|nr:anhydro-N-acetylmuramic acid kinase [Rickettsiaceae bacterium]
MNKELYIGLMSGTSGDGIDASLIETDGDSHFVAVENLHIPYKYQFQKKLKELFINHDDHEKVSLIEQEFTEHNIAITKKLLHKANIDANEIKAIGFAGQTIIHRPEQGITWQIGNSNLLAKETAINVVYDFRKSDIANGGQGAPLVPIFHQLLTKREKKPVAIVNIGGIANITYIDNNNQLIAFDTGLGNALIDDMSNQYFNKSYDKDGIFAAKGKIDHDIITKILQDDYFNKNYPKSLDRNYFSYIKEQISPKLSPYDIIATLTYITAKSIFQGIKLLPQMPTKLYLCGGGSHNPMIRKFLETIFQQQNIQLKLDNIQALNNNIDTDFIESQAFAYLAARFYAKLPSSFSNITGVNKPTILGSVDICQQRLG